jgi:serine protease Do
MKSPVRAVLFVLSLTVIAALSIAAPLVFTGRVPPGIHQATAATLLPSPTVTAAPPVAAASTTPGPVAASSTPTSAPPSPTAVSTPTTTPAPVSTVAVAGSDALPGVVADLQTTLQKVYGIVNPSVVHIWGRVMPELGQEVIAGEEMLLMPDPCSFTDPLPLQSQGSLGSGFVWDEEGHIVTNNHVIKDVDHLNITFSDGLTLPAKIVGQDEHTDLAVLQVDAPAGALHPVTIADSTVVTPGLFTLAIGNPFGCTGSMSFGVVSAVGRSLPTWDENATFGISAREVFADIIQTDTSLNTGSSGGVLADLQGRLVGVTFAGMDVTDTGVGFAIPSVVVQRVVPALIEHGSYEPAWFGATTRSVMPQLAVAMGLPATQQGALVEDVTLDSPADRAGLRGSSKKTTVEGDEVMVGGDIILAVDGQRINRSADLDMFLVRNTQPGQKVQLEVLRDGEKITLEATIAALPPPEGTEPVEVGGGEPGGGAWLGIDGVTLTAELAEAMGLKSDQPGVLLQTVVAGSPADQAALHGGYRRFQAGSEWVMIGGDVVVEADGEALDSAEALAELLGKKSPGDTMTLVVLRDGGEMEVSVTLGSSPEQTM